MTSLVAIANSITPDERAFFKLARGERSIAIAIQDRRFSIWYDDEEDAPKHGFGRDFMHAREQVIELIQNALAAGMELVSNARDPGLKEFLFAENVELELACRTSPDDPDPWSVYADWLLERSDLRGEVAAFRQKGDDARADRLLRLRRDVLFGALHDDLAAITDWRHGFPIGVELRGGRGRSSIANVLQTFLGLPLATFVEKFRLELRLRDDDNDWSVLLDTLLDWRFASHIRALQLSDFVYQDEPVPADDLSSLWHLPQLEELVISGSRSNDLGPIVAPQMKMFRRFTPGLRVDELATIAAATWPKLEDLELHFGSAEYGGECQASDLTSLLTGARVPNLHRLGLVGCGFSYQALEALLQSAILPRLRYLNLSFGSIGHAEYELLIANRDRLSHLELLDVSENYLLRAQVARLRRELPRILADSQRELPGDDDGDDEVD